MLFSKNILIIILGVGLGVVLGGVPLYLRDAGEEGLDAVRNCKQQSIVTNYILVIVSPDVSADPNCKGTFGDVKFPIHQVIKPVSEENCSGPPEDFIRTCSGMFEKGIKDLVDWAQRSKQMNTVSITVSDLHLDQDDLKIAPRAPIRTKPSSQRWSHHNIHHNHHRKLLPHIRVYRSVNFKHKTHKPVASAEPLDSGEPVDPTDPVDSEDDIYDFDLLPDQPVTTQVSIQDPENQIISEIPTDKPKIENLNYQALKPKDPSQMVDYFDKISDFPVAISADMAAMISDIVSEVASDAIRTTDITTEANQLGVMTTPATLEEQEQPLGILRKIKNKNENGGPLFELIPAIGYNSKTQQHYLRSEKATENRNHVTDNDEDLDSTTEELQYRTTRQKITPPKITKPYLDKSIDGEVPTNTTTPNSTTATTNTCSPAQTVRTSTIVYTNVPTEEYTGSTRGTPGPKSKCGHHFAQYSSQKHKQHCMNDDNTEKNNRDGSIDLVSSLKQEFYHTFLDSMISDQSNSSPSLLAMTQNLLEQMDSIPNSTGYLAIIKGGYVSDLKNCSSDLVKTLHFIRNIGEDTQIVVILTASCPPENMDIPFLVMGENIDIFTEVQELQDVLSAIRIHIEGVFDSNSRPPDKNRISSNKGVQENVKVSKEKINQLFESFPNGDSFGNELAESLVAPSDVWYSDLRFDSDYDQIADVPDHEHDMVKRESSGDHMITIQIWVVIIGVVLNILIYLT